MNRTDALRHFKETYVKEKSNEKLFLLEEYFQEHKDCLSIAFVESFRQACIKIKEMQLKKEKGKIGYITYSMLRTGIAEGKADYLLEAFDKHWFLDFEECHAGYDAGWAFGFLNGLRTELEEKGKLYIGAVVASDVGNIIQSEAGKFNEYVISLARYAMPLAIALDEYKEIDKEEELEVRVGEYRDISEVVCKEDTGVKNSEKIREWLNERLEDEYSFEVFRGLDLQAGDYNHSDLSYADFMGSNLSKSRMTGCILVGTKFSGGFLEGADLSGSLIYGADFSHCSLKGAVFCGAEGAEGLHDRLYWERPGYTGVSFKGAELEGADFKKADLKGAVFIGADLKNVNFTEADLKNAVFLKKDSGLLNLDELQIRDIKWK